MWRATSAEIVRVKCNAPEPANSTRAASSSNGTCNQPLGDVPGPLRRVGTRGGRLPERPDGRVWLQCTRCQSWNVLEVIEDG